MRRVMMSVAVLCVSVLTLTATTAWTQKKEVDPATLEATLVWLAVMDTGLYEEGWNQSHPLFQGKVDREEWLEEMRRERSPLGEVKSREVFDSGYFGKIPNHPGLEMTVIQFQSEFENKPRAIETLSPVRMNGGPWKIGGYVIADSADFKVQ